MIVTDGTPYLAVIPARGGSKGVPGKNIRLLAGRPLFAWSIEHVRRCLTPMRVIVSTDDAQTADLAIAAGAEVPVLRPSHLAEDESPTEPALIHALATAPDNDSISHVVLLQPTSPIRDGGTIDAAVSLYASTGSDSLVGVVESSPFLWMGTSRDPRPLYDVDGRLRRQDFSDAQRVYRETGSIYITGADRLREFQNRLSGQMAMLPMQEHEGLEIDTEFDFWVAEQWMRENHVD
jgi:CMP-N,N'-diacetyllegionaminic acid synthase